MRTPSFTGFRHVFISLAVLALLLGSVSFAAAQEPLPPPNDDIANATVISDVPFTDQVNAQGATYWDPTDPPNCPAYYSVWYTFTPAVNMRIDVAFFGSNYDTFVGVFSGTPGALTPLSCNYQHVVFDVSAGTTYYFLASSPYGSDNDNLVFSVMFPFKIGVTIDKSGSVNGKTGIATVSGTVTCNRTAHIDLYEGRVVQPVGRFNTIQGYFEVRDIACTPGGATHWQATVYPYSGKFGGGSATVFVHVEGNDLFYAVDSAEAITTITFKGK